MHTDKPSPKNPSGASTLTRNLGIESIHKSNEKSMLRMTVQDDHLNNGGVMHGGVMATLMDSTCGTTAVFGYKGGATASLTINYLAPVHLGDVLTCTAILKKRTHTLAFVDAQTINQDGELVATATSVFRVIYT